MRATCVGWAKAHDRHLPVLRPSHLPSTPRGWSFACLRRLDLRDVAHVLTDETLTELPTPSLVELRLSGSRVTCVGLNTALAASAGTSLTALHLDGCRRVDDAALRRLPALVPALRHLTLAGCVRVTDAGVAALMRTTANDDAAESGESRCDESAGPCAPALTSISLSFCRQVGDAAMRSLACACPTLRSAHVRGTSVTDRGVRWLALLPLLHTLDVAMCEITQQALTTMASGMHRLTEVSLSSCPGVLNDLTALARVRSLHTLDVSGCAVGDDELVALAAKLRRGGRRLRTLRVSSADRPAGGVTANGAAALAALLPQTQLQWADTTWDDRDPIALMQTGI